MLTAAHCVLPGADYKVIIPGETPPRLLDVRRVASHPQFNVQSILAHRASADVALLQLAGPAAREQGARAARRADDSDRGRRAASPSPASA